MISKKFCPQCGSENVELASGGITGFWVCRNCGYRGAVLEKEILGSEEKTNDPKGNR